MSGSSQYVLQEFKDYAYSVSHDLSAPVRAMVEFSKLLQQDEAQHISERSQLYLDMIIENGQKLQHMMQSLLEYSRLNTVAHHYDTVDTQSVIEHCIHHLATSEATITYSQPLPQLYASAPLLKSLFTILFTNALSYRHPERTPCIHIDIEDRDAYWECSVKDNGVGIEPQVQDFIFGLFQRLHSYHEQSGIGMGLALAKKIVQQHHGNIWCVPVEDDETIQGTIFYFTLAKEQAYATHNILQ